MLKLLLLLLLMSEPFAAIDAVDAGAKNDLSLSMQNATCRKAIDVVHFIVEAAALNCCCC